MKKWVLQGINHLVPETYQSLTMHPRFPLANILGMVTHNDRLVAKFARRVWSIDSKAL